MITVTIDGKPIQVKNGASVMEAALDHGIEIPHLCYHPELSISGGCRLCVVEVDGRPRPTPSCELACQDGMVVRTQSPLLTSLRREVIDLFLTEHPLHCVICEKAGSCLLQKYAYELNIRETSYPFRLDRTLYQDDNPFFVRDHQYCILCGRCVRVCDEVVGASAIDFAGHGYEVHIATPFDAPLAETSCVFCGSCVQVCPTAALMPVSRKGKGREWELNRVRSICGYCGVGCQVEYAVQGGKIVYAQSTPDASVNGEFLCTKGRYGWDFATNPERLTQPLVRRDLAYQLGLVDQAWQLPQTSPLQIHKPDLEASHIPVDWETALDLVAENLARTTQKFGPDAVMGLASARCTNEENYLFQKFIRAGVGTNNIDHCARL
jgi:formate dehydrogenase alpha subunit